MVIKECLGCTHVWYEAVTVEIPNSAASSPYAGLMTGKTQKKDREDREAFSIENGTARRKQTKGITY